MDRLAMIDVLVIGAGPTGTTLAIDLARRGLNVRIIDRQAAAFAEREEDEADRFAKLALRHPEMLTHEEQIRWKLVRENGYLWRGKYEGAAREWTWRVDEDRLIFERLREHWDLFCAVARGEIDKSKLPTWLKKDPEPIDDSDIPF